MITETMVTNKINRLADNKAVDTDGLGFPLDKKSIGCGDRNAIGTDVSGVSEVREVASAV